MVNWKLVMDSQTKTNIHCLFSTLTFTQVINAKPQFVVVKGEGGGVVPVERDSFQSLIIS